MIAHNDCNLTMHKTKIFSRRKQGCHATLPGNLEKHVKTWKNLEFDILGKKKTIKTWNKKILKKRGKT